MHIDVYSHDIDTGDRLLTEIDISQQPDFGGIVSNAFGEHYLFGINRTVFQGTDASTVFRSYFGEEMFKEDTFYVIAGTDSGLLYQYVKANGVPKGSRYLFVELPEVQALLETMDGIENKLAVTSEQDWLQHAIEMDVKKYAYLGRLKLFHSLGVVHGHFSNYAPFWRKLKADFDFFVENLRILVSVRPFTICQIENLTENQIPAINLKDTFNGKTAVVLAGGPSLDELLPWVRQHRENLLVIAVSRISRSLLQAGIQPDISVSVDPQAFNLNVCKEMLEFQDVTLLVNSYHLSPNLLASWGGQKVYVGPRYPWTTPLEPKNLSTCKGTTVTNTALDLAVQMGAAQVVLGGADFCFSQEGYTHASGTAEHAMGSRPQLCDTQVETNGGMMADTENGYLESGMSVDSQAQDALARGCRVINPARGAMRLPHVEHLSLDEISIEPLKQPARQILANNLPSNDKSSRIPLYKEALGEVDRVLAELRSIKELSDKALSYNKKVLAKGHVNDDDTSKSSQLDPVTAKKVDRIEIQLNTKYADTVAFVKHFGVSHFIPILGLDVAELEDLVENSQIFFQALTDTSKELIEILHQARSRILCRLEEEKPQPKLQRLLDQWNHDQQPGRAILWAQQHVDYVSELPEAQQQALQAFQDTFDDSVEILGQQYATNIEQGGELDGIAGRAREYFLCRDQEGLQRLLEGIHTHRDQQQAAYFIPLLTGYIEELRDEPVLAIEAYQKIVDGANYLDALMRLFELHTRAENWDKALSALKSLAGISSTYSPLYADMLQATGAIDNAIEIYTDYLLANPDDLNTMMKLGKLFHQCGSDEGVEWTMSYILGKDPNNQTAKEILNSISPSMKTNSTHP